MRERVVAMGKEEGKRNPVAQEGTRRYWPHLSLSLSCIRSGCVSFDRTSGTRFTRQRESRASRETVPAVSAGNYQPRAKDGNGIVR